MAEKHNKADVKYSDGMPSAHCGICRYYIGKGAIGGCTKVAGEIRASMWCKLFKRKD